jgi:hypothetical protein
MNQILANGIEAMRLYLEISKRPLIDRRALALQKLRRLLRSAISSRKEQA